MRPKYGLSFPSVQKIALGRLEYEPGAPSVAKIHLGAHPCALGMGNAGHDCFLLLLCGKVRFLSPTLCGNSPYKYHSSHS